MLGAPMSTLIARHPELFAPAFADRRLAVGTLVGVPRASVSTKPCSTSRAARRINLRLGAPCARGSGIAAASRSCGRSKCRPLPGREAAGPAAGVSRRRLADGRFVDFEFFELGTVDDSFAAGDAKDAPIGRPPMAVGR